MKYIITLILTTLFSATVIYADIEKTEDQAAFFLRHFKNKNVIKSGTPALLNLLYGDSDESRSFKAAYAERERPSMEAFKDSEEGHFRVHYNLSGNNAPDLTDINLNGVPDYVDSALVYLEYEWQLIVVTLGYGQPKYDGTRGGSIDIIDCYLQELSTQSLYGYTSPDITSGGPVSSYMIIDNDFSEPVYPTKGYDALKITTAHEFFHVIHYTYYGGSDAIWWMEHSAVWMENKAWDDVNDYLNYFGFLYLNRDLPIDTYNGSFEYGASLFAFHIAQKYGESYIRAIWNSFRDNQNGKIENMNTILPEGIAQTISNFAVWTYFTGNRANSRDFFKEANLITNTMTPDKTTAEQTTVDSLSFKHYTFKYIDITPEKGFSYGDSLYFKFEDRNGGMWKNQVILYTSPYNYIIEQLPDNQPSIFIPRPFNKAVLVVTNAAQLNKNYKLVYTIDIQPAKGVEREPQSIPFALLQNFPNPFNNTTTLTYSLNNTSHIILKIMNLSGQTVATLIDGVRYPGIYNETFDGADLSSGLYFAVLESGRMRLVSKMSLIK